MTLELTDFELAILLLLIATGLALYFGMAAFFRLQDRLSPVGRLVRGGAR